ncbi:hypothetical protein [Kitasatospora sp. NPDC059673]|uniref:hypothetical protein n=1 Tax=Kitasatospora sp. NPDC059673 TaxID=3346901 RepID=UPI003683FB8F
MRIHRSAQSSESTAIANDILQNCDLSFVARGVLAYLLSLPDDSWESAKNLADTGIEGRATIKRATDELKAAGYYRLVKRRLPAGRIVSEIHVHDTPQLPSDTDAPGTEKPGAGAASVGAPGGSLVKQVKETTPLPPPAPSGRLAPDAASGRLTPSGASGLDEPGQPDELGELGAPDLPGGPDLLGEPDLPDGPGLPTEPNQPDEADQPGEPSQPDEPNLPDGPGRPGLPGLPDEPGEPVAPDLPGVPDEPEQPGEPREPSGLETLGQLCELGGLGWLEGLGRRQAPGEPCGPDVPGERVGRAEPDEPGTPAKSPQRAERAVRTQRGPRAARGAARAAMDEKTREAVAALFRAIRNEPRLRLGEAEARRLAPLVMPWLERGLPEADLVRAVTSDMPANLTSPAGLIRYRLVNKLPPVPAPAPPAPGPRPECAKCCDPIPQPGICGPCAGLGARRVPAVGGGAAFARAGAARVREAMQWVTRPGKSALGNPVPAG